MTRGWSPGATLEPRQETVPVGTRGPPTQGVWRRPAAVGGPVCQ